MTDQTERAAIHRVVLSTCEAMEKQLQIEASDIESDLTAKLDTARTIATAALASAFKDDEQTMYEVLEWFSDSLAQTLCELTTPTHQTKH